MNFGLGHRFGHPSPVTPPCGVTGLFGALRHGPIRGAERRRMRYTAERCNEWRNCVAETMTKAEKCN